MKNRIYVCHTMYHVYVALLKEMEIIRKGECEKADIALSSMFMDFGDLPSYLRKVEIFDEILPLDEKRFTDFPELLAMKEDQGNLYRNLKQRIRFTKAYGKKQEEFIHIDFKSYKDIYVFCDSDPIGYYLHTHKIKYHAVEDGLDCLKRFDAAHYDNRGHFGLKAFLAKLGWIHIQNGYDKYCIDMEINDDSYFDYKFSKYKVVPRKPLEDALTKEQKKQMVQVFIPGAEELLQKLSGKEDCVLFLTEAYPKEAEIRKAVAKEIVETYCKDTHVIIKPHPRDDIDYEKVLPDCTVVTGKFPIEVLNYVEGIRFRKTISIITSALDTIHFCEEKINIGPSIWDKYEDPEKHAFMVNR